MSEIGVYTGLFFAAFLAATILPAQSEVGLAALILSGDFVVPVLVVVASVGNTAGAVVNWCMGRWIDRYSDRRWFPASPDQLARSMVWYRKYGRWSLLLSWVPFIGDPITVIAGVLRESLVTFVLIVCFAKTTRYVVIAVLAAGWM